MISQALKNLSTKVVKPDVEWNNEYTPKIQSTVKPDKEYTFNEISDNLYKQIRPKTANKMIIKHYGLMTWADAIDLGIETGALVPNKRQSEELNLVGTWTSTTDRYDTSRAIVLGEAKSPVKTELRPVVTINESNYTPDTVAYRTGDEGCGHTGKTK